MVFFHRYMIQSRKTKKIIWLHNSQGLTLHYNQDIQEELINYLQDLLTDPKLDRQDENKMPITNIPHLVNEDQYKALLWPITLEEVEIVANQTPEGKSPGLDGFTYEFFHYYQDFIKNDIWKLVEES